MANAPHYAKGRYRATVTDVGFKQLDNGDSQIVLKVQPGAMLQGNQWAMAQGPERQVWLYVPDPEQAADPEKAQKGLHFVGLKLRATGWTGTKFSQLSDLKGETVEVICDHKPGRNGQGLFDNFDLPLPPRELDHSQDAQVAHKLDGLLAATLGGIAPGKAVDMPVVKAAAGTAPDDQGGETFPDDDIPF